MARRAVWIVGGGIALIGAAAVALFGFAATRGPGWVGGQVERATGRETRIGALAFDWGWTTTVRMTDVAVANADWGQADNLFTAREVRVAVRLPPLLRGRLDFPMIEVDVGRIALERQADGESNWSFSSSPVTATAVDAVAPEERTEVPSIGRLRITDSSLSIRDAQRQLDLDGSIATASGSASGGDRIELTLKGAMAGEALAMRFVGGSMLMLRDGAEPYPADLQVSFGRTKIRVDGTLKDPVAFEGADVRMALSGPNLADVFPLLGIPAPPSPPYSVEGRLHRNGDVWVLKGMTGRIGDSDVTGDVSVDYGPKRPFLKATLASGRLDFDDLAPLIGLPPEAGDQETASDAQRKQLERMRSNDQLFPDTPLEVKRLHAMDMDVTLTSDRVHSRAFLAVTSIDARVRVKNGRAEANPLRLGVAGGTVHGTMALNARSEIPSAAADLVFEGLNMAAFFKGTDFYETMGGTIRGRLALLGSGRSLAGIMKTAGGSAALAMSGGAMSGLLIEGAGLDLGEALILVIGDDAKVPIRCAMARLDVRDGRALIEKGVMDTTDSALFFRGSLNLQDQTLILDIEADAKDFSLLDIDAPVHLEGPIRNPKISIGKGAPIPLIELGDGEDVPCDALAKEYLKPQQKS